MSSTPVSTQSTQVTLRPPVIEPLWLEWATLAGLLAFAGWLLGVRGVWANAIENGKPAAQPCAYRLPYSKDLHGLLNEGMKKIRQGVTQMGTTEPVRGRKGPSWLRPGSDEQQVKIRDMPVPQLPEK